MTIHANIQPVTETAAGVRLVAEYQLFSDHPGRDWMNQTLYQAIESGDIAAYNVAGCYPGPFGIQLVMFTVDVLFGDRFTTDMGYAQASGVGTALLNEIIGDSDVQVRWVSPIS